MNAQQFVKNSLIKARCFWKNYLLGGWNSKIPHHVFFKAASLLRGFWPDSAFIYRKRGWKKGELISDYHRCLRGPFINARGSYILDDKLVFDRFFADAIHYSFHVSNGRLIPNSLPGASGDDLLPLLKHGKKFIIKPRRGGGGNRVRLIRHEKGSFFVNEKPFTQFDFLKEILGYQDDLIYPFFQQNGFSHEIFPGTLNTIRILAMVDPEQNRPFIARALHRFGTTRSFPVDNWSSGGICAAIDVESGVMGPGVIFPYEKELSWHQNHPETLKPIAGQVVPNWKRIKEMTLASHEQILFLPYIGWDIVLSGDEILILEGNANSDVNLFQVHRPLLDDAGLRTVFRHYRLAGK
jgi:hypothetical protein